MTRTQSWAIAFGFGVLLVSGVALADTNITLEEDDSEVIYGRYDYWLSALSVWMPTDNFMVCAYDEGDSRWEYRGYVSDANMQDTDYEVTMEGSSVSYYSTVYVEEGPSTPTECYYNGSYPFRVTEWRSAWNTGIVFDFADADAEMYIDGTPEDDTIYGAEDDVNFLFGNDGEDIIFGGINMEDYIQGGDDLDIIYAQGAGIGYYEKLYGDDEGALLICAGYYDDSEPYDCGCDGVEGRMSADSATSMPPTGAHYVIGCGGDDSIEGFEDDDYLDIYGGNGDDRIDLYSGNRAFGENGEDDITAEGDIIYVSGGDDDDIIDAEGRELAIFGNDDDDTISVVGQSAGPSYDYTYIFGGGGDDIIDLWSNDMMACGDYRVSVLDWSCDMQDIGDGADTITGHNINDTYIFGSGGCDDIVANAKSIYSDVYLAGGTLIEGDQACDDVDGDACSYCTCDNGTYRNCEDWGAYDCSGFELCD